MAETGLRPLYSAVEYKHLSSMYREGEEVVAVGKPARGAMLQMPLMPTPLEPEPYGQGLEAKWWPVSNAAYGTVLPTGKSVTLVRV